MASGLAAISCILERSLQLGSLTVIVSFTVDGTNETKMVLIKGKVLVISNSC